jgi:peptidoglycan/LPS O-acetylase OafA/YrhL
VAGDQPVIRQYQVCAACVSAVATSSAVFYYLPLFFAGLACLEVFQRAASVTVVWAITALTGIIFWRMGGVAAVASLATVAGILFIPRSTPVLDWLGAVSYSLYLIHVPIGCKAVNLGRRYTDSAWVPVAAMALCLIAAHLFFRAVEQPSVR